MFAVHIPGSHVLAKATAADVFKSVQDNVADTHDASGKALLYMVLGTVAVVLVLSLSSLRRTRQVKPKALNHPGKLLKEIMRRISLRPVEMKQLRLLAETASDRGATIENPLVMILCPSVLAKSLKAPPARIDRKVIAALARKMGVPITRGKKA